MTDRPAHAGDLLRRWRQRRRLSQLDLAIAADVSSRHLSFVETGRSRPTSDMILRLAEHLDVPLRDRNALLLAGGYAPAYPERGLAEPELQAVRKALQRVLKGHELNFLSITAVVGTPVEVTVSELAIESFYPADAPTAAALG